MYLHRCSLEDSEIFGLACAVLHKYTQKQTPTSDCRSYCLHKVKMCDMIVEAPHYNRMPSDACCFQSSNTHTFVCLRERKKRAECISHHFIADFCVNHFFWHCTKWKEGHNQSIMDHQNIRLTEDRTRESEGHIQIWWLSSSSELSLCQKI